MDKERHITLTASDIKAINAVAEGRTVRTSTIDPDVHRTGYWRTTTEAGDVYQTHWDGEQSPSWSCSCRHGLVMFKRDWDTECWHRTAAELALAAEIDWAQEHADRLIDHHLEQRIHERDTQ